MSVKPQVNEARFEHVPWLAAHMRQQDRQEIYAVNHSSPEKALADSIAVSTMAFSYMDGEKTLGMWGVAAPSMLSEIGVPWFLGSDELIRKHGFTMAKRTMEFVNLFLYEYPVLLNYVDARNDVSIRWLKWAGFTFDEAKPYGVEGLPFYKFEMRRI